MKINFKKVNDLLLNKYQASIISKQQFKDAIYGPNRTDLDDDICCLTEGIIDSENAIFYLINKVKILNKYCKCVNPAYTGEITEITPLTEFFPYIVFVAELSEDKTEMVNYAKWGSFADNIFDELYSLKEQQDNILAK